MNKTIISAVVAFAAFAATPVYAQKFTWKETTHDFGTIDEADGTASFDFTFTNTGDKPLIIKQVISGCGCTSAKWSSKAYAPGAKGTVRISYHPEGRKMADFSIPSEVFTNLKEPATLTITGKVTLQKHPYVNFFDPTKGERKTYKAQEPRTTMNWYCNACARISTRVLL